MSKRPKSASVVVPEAEQPYKIPDNWQWVTLGSVSSNQYGYTAKAVSNNSYPKMLRITDIQEGNVNWNETPNCEISPEDFAKYKLNCGDIVIARIGATTGKSYLLKNPPDSVFASYLIRLRLSENAQIPYVYYFLQSDLYWKQISELSVGIALPGVNSSKLQTMAFPLPPLAEQQRIVERIESLFAKLDEAREKAQAVVDGFELRKAAILYRAFSGELTAQWRKTHGLRRSDWKHCQFRELCEIVRGGSPRPAGDLRYYNGNIPFMKVADITNNLSPYVSVAEHTIKEAGLKKTRMISANTLLLTNSGATLGVPAICTFNTTINDGIAAFLNLDSEFLLFYYYFWLGKTQELRSINMGMAQPNLNTNIIGNVEIDLPTDIEKREIVRIVNATLSRQEQAKNAAQEVIERIDAMKKAILGRAFRGELGTNDPSEASPDFALTVR